MKFGISAEQYKLLDELVIQPLVQQGAQVFLFGSRATGKHHPNSDVDILYKVKKEMPAGYIAEINEAIEESHFPFTVELVNDENLASSYRKSVESQLVHLAG